MKKSFLLLPLVAGLCYVTLSSNSSGYPLNATGSDGSTAIGCGGGGCHGTAAASFTPTIVLDSAGTGTLVTKYTPGKTYIIRFGAINTVGGTLPKFGFQFSVVKTSGLANGGTMGAITGATTFGTGITVAVQSAPMMPLTGAGGAGTVYKVDVPWTAPVAGTGAVKAYGIINLVDENGGATASDKWSSANATFQERTVSAVDEIANNIEVNAFPNPVISNLNIQLNGANAGVYSIHVFDMSGRLVINQAANGNAVVNMQHFTAGMYQVVIGKDGVNKTISVVKE